MFLSIDHVNVDGRKCKNDPLINRNSNRNQVARSTASRAGGAVRVVSGSNNTSQSTSTHPQQQQQQQQHNSSRAQALRQSAAFQVQISRQLNFNFNWNPNGSSKKIRRRSLLQHNKKKRCSKVSIAPASAAAVPSSSSSSSSSSSLSSKSALLSSILETSRGTSSCLLLLDQDGDVNNNSYYNTSLFDIDEFEEWKDRETKAFQRAQSQFCSICHELYDGTVVDDDDDNNNNRDRHQQRHQHQHRHRQQSILSCSHIFHSTCISSFESFVGYENRFCPLCRLERYDAKPTNMGTLVRREQAAMTMQKMVRGWHARIMFRDGLSILFDGNGNGNGKGNGNGRQEDRDSDMDMDSRCQPQPRPQPRTSTSYKYMANHDPEKFVRIRQRYYSRELKDLGNKVTRAVDRNESSIHTLTCTIEESLALSREMSNLLLREEQQPSMIHGGNSSSSSRKGGRIGADTGPGPGAGAVHWDVILKAALGRNSTKEHRQPQKLQLIDCPICMCTMNTDTTSASSSASCPKRSLTVLNCTHLFHTNCINALEKFQEENALHRNEGHDASSSSPSSSSSSSSVCTRVCPVCRSMNYEKMQIVL